MTESEKERLELEEYRREEAEQEAREEALGDAEKCPECGAVMRYECISSDADGNRQEWAHMCPNCD